MKRERLEREQFLEQVSALRKRGLTVRGIAAELGIHPSRAQRALKGLHQKTAIHPPLEPGVIPNLNRAARDSFVGRHRELEALRSNLEDALSGQGRLVMLAGEPGIGKTRTAQELAFDAERKGAQVLWGRCYEEDGTPPYWPWIQIIRSCLQQWEREQLASVMGPGAADIAEIVPQVREIITGLNPPSTLEPEQARFRLFDSISTFQKNAARTIPLMLVIDDLHWGDQASLLLLQFLARQMADSRLLLVGCYRDVELSRHHPLADTLAQLAREPVLRRVPLRGLSRQETGRFIEITSGLRSNRSLAEIIYAHTEGNPFFMTEVVRLLRERGELSLGPLTPAQGERAGPQSIAIPDGVREVIGQRVNRLSDLCHQTLTIGAIIGREFEFRLLNRLSSGVPEERLLAVMDEALEAHLIEELPGSAEGYQFSHALVQQTLARDLSAARRVRLHAQIGEALEELYGPDTLGHNAELAYHFSEAVTVLGTEKVAHYSLLAGEQALAAYAYEEALGYFHRGLAAKGIALPGTAPVEDAETAGLLFGLARAQSATHGEDQIMETSAALRRAFDYYAEAENIALAVAAAEFPIDNTGRARGSVELVVRALALVPGDSYEAGRLLSRYGGILGLSQGDYEGAQLALGRALSIARREGDVALEAQTLTYAADVCGQHLHWRESADHGLRAISLAPAHEINHSAVLSRWWTSVSLLHIGELEQARPHASVLRDLAAKQSAPRYFSTFSLVPIVTLSCLEGDWNAGRECCNRSLKRVPTFQQLLCARVLLEYQTGEFEPGKICLAGLLDEMRRGITPFALGKGPMTLIEVARITDDINHLDVAESTAEALLSEPSVSPIVAMYARVGLALLAVHRNDQSAAAEHYAYFREHQGTMIWTLISVDRLIALLSQAAGNLNLASEHFEDALAFSRKAGYRPELAWTCHDYAAGLLRRNAPGDHARATSLVDESWSISGELGMRPLQDRVASLRGQAQSHSPKGPAYPGGLTQREVEVLRLVASGQTSGEIAAELVLSRRTVERHISNIYNKTNRRSRAEVTVFAFTQGLMSFS